MEESADSIGLSVMGGMLEFGLLVAGVGRDEKIHSIILAEPASTRVPPILKMYHGRAL